MWPLASQELGSPSILTVLTMLEELRGDPDTALLPVFETTSTHCDLRKSPPVSVVTNK